MITSPEFHLFNIGVTYLIFMLLAKCGLYDLSVE